MKLLNVEVVGAICIVRDMDGNTILEVIGDKVHWVKDDFLGNSSLDFVNQYHLRKGDKPA